MIVYPAIDLSNGKCVRLTKGDFNTTKIYHDNPLVMLNEFAISGAKWIHMVDLDGAKQGSFAQIELIEQLLVSTKLNIQVGGGIRSYEDVKLLFNLGVKRVVLGSICVSKPEIVLEWIKEFGAEKIVLALDCTLDIDNNPLIKTHGWQAVSQLTIWELLDFYSLAKYVLCTDISVDGTLAGPNLNLYKLINNRYPHIDLIASGGVGKYEDLLKLASIKIHGVVVGKAIYENKIKLEQLKKFML